MATKNKIEKSAVRNAIAVMMAMRFGKTTTTMKDRRAPKGGTKNKQRAYINGDY